MTKSRVIAGRCCSLGLISLNVPPKKGKLPPLRCRSPSCCRHNAACSECYAIRRAVAHCNAACQDAILSIMALPAALPPRRTPLIGRACRRSSVWLHRCPTPGKMGRPLPSRVFAKDKEQNKEVSGAKRSPTVVPPQESRGTDEKICI